MARAPLTVRTLPTKWAILPTTVTWETPDVAQGNYFVSTGQEFVLVNNTGGVAHTITVASVADAEGRTGDINAESIDAAAIKVYQVFTQDGWMQANGQIYVNINHADLKICVCKFP